MMLANPWGLLGLLAWPLILWLHRHRFQGQRKTVSAVFLWQQDTSLQAEGAVKSRLPLSWVLWLELLTALLLSLALAQPHWHRSQAQTRLGLLLDGSASMAGSSAGQLSPWQAMLAVVEQIQQTSPQLQITAVISGPSPQVLGGERVTPIQLRQQLQQFQPQHEGHSIYPAMQVLTALFPQAEHTLALSDDPRLPYPRWLHLGQPADNSGFIAATWNLGESPFVVVQHFGSTRPTALQVQSDDPARPSWQQPLIFDATGIATALLSASGATRLQVQLPADALALDNQVVLLAPQPTALRMRLDIGPPAQAYFQKLQAALPGLKRVNDAAHWVVSQATPPDKTAFTTLFLPPQQKTVWQTDLLLNSQHPLMAGVETHGLILYSHPRSPPATATVLLQSATSPLIWLESRDAAASSDDGQPQQLVFNLDLAKSNWFQHSSFPVLFYNWVELLSAAQGGLSRWNYRQGELIQLSRPRSVPMTAPVQLHNAQGQKMSIADTGAVIRLGRLSAGVYQLSAGDWHTSLAVNFLDGGESDLTQRLPPEPLPTLGIVTQTQVQSYPLLPMLVILAVLSVVLTWFLLRNSR